MAHFYLNPKNINDDDFFIDEQDFHYLVNVRRFKINDEIMLFDGLGKSFSARILEISKNKISGKIISFSYKPQGKIVNLWTAIPKGDRFEWLIEKACELGIAALFPIIAARSAQTSFSENKKSRLKKIALSACSQCGRSDMMEIADPVDVKAAFKNAADMKIANILAWESEERLSLSELFEREKIEKANIFIGPEGGFENDEIDLAKSLNFITASLGENILRIETAAIAAAVLALNDRCRNKNKEE
jgi:16S rRNA (uracil1498-N3)-methyltransferase